MDADQAARRLSELDKAPRGAVSVSALFRSSNPEILVWYDPRYKSAVSHLPAQFEGFNVRVEPRKLFISA